MGGEIILTVQRIQQTFGSIELDHMRNRKCYTPSAERILKQFYKPELSIEENRALATERHAIVKRINEVSLTHLWGKRDPGLGMTDWHYRTPASSPDGFRSLSSTTTGRDKVQG